MTDSDSADSVPHSVDVKHRLEMASNIYANTRPQVTVEGMHAILMTIRDRLVAERSTLPEVTPQKFAAWVEDHDADPDQLPEAWGAEYIDLVTGILAKLVREENIQPVVVVDALDEYVDETTEQIKEVYGIEEGFFDGV